MKAEYLIEPQYERWEAPPPPTLQLLTDPEHPKSVVIRLGDEQTRVDAAELARAVEGCRL